MRIAICDDEREMRNIIAEKITKLYPKEEILFYQSGEEVLADEGALDILFLDIQMAGKDGIETAKELRRRKQKVILIFVTVMKEYVFQAFDVGAFHYLVKPIDDLKFEKVLKNAIAQVNKRAAGKNSSFHEESYIIVKTKGITRKILLNDIIYAEVFNRNIILHLKNEQIEYYGKLKELETISGNTFFRTHRAYLVNLKYVTSYEAGKVYMKDKEVLLSKSNYSEFVKGFLHYHRRNED